MAVHLVLGGARSGKSTHAEKLCQKIARDRGQLKQTYLATAIAFDGEMEQRVAHHRERRDDSWNLREEPHDIATVINEAESQDTLLVDCLTVWLNNVIFAQGDMLSSEQIHQEVKRVCDALQASEADIVLVSNEVGLGVVPLGEVSRLFVDHAGWMNQAIAEISHSVTLVAAGLPLTLKAS